MVAALFGDGAELARAVAVMTDPLRAIIKRLTMDKSAVIRAFMITSYVIDMAVCPGRIS